MMRITVVSLALISLTACQPQSPDGKKAEPPADARSAAADAMAVAVAGNMDISKPISALGTEPFWSVTVDGTALTLKRPDVADTAFTAPGAAVQPGRATWIAKAADGAQLTLTIYASDCSDGMSDRKYPWVAEVTLVGESLRGCAATTAALKASPAP